MPRHPIRMSFAKHAFGTRAQDARHNDFGRAIGLYPYYVTFRASKVTNDEFRVSFRAALMVQDLNHLQRCVIVHDGVDYELRHFEAGAVKWIDPGEFSNVESKSDVPVITAVYRRV